MSEVTPGSKRKRRPQSLPRGLETVPPHRAKDFWWSVKVGTPDECWPWLGFCGPKGYGRYYVNGVTHVATRVSYAIHHGPVPEGSHLLHSCDNPPCVNPHHLRLGTNLDNHHDRARNMIREAQAKIATPCQTCYALVRAEDEELHLTWHQSLRG